MIQVASASAPIGCQILSCRYSATGRPTAATSTSPSTSVSTDAYENFVPTAAARSLYGVTAATPPGPTCWNVSATSVETSSTPVYSSTKRTPEDICRRCRSDVRHVGRGGIVHGADAPLVDRDADQHRGDRLGHRPGGEPIVIGAPVLIALDENRVVSRDQEPGRRVTRHEVVDGERAPLVLVAQRRLGGPRQR